MSPGKARRKRGLTWHGAARQAGVHHQTLRNLEKSPLTVGPSMTAFTLISILDFFYPDVRLEDVGIEANFDLVDIRRGHPLAPPERPEPPGERRVRTVLQSPDLPPAVPLPASAIDDA